RHDGEQHQDGAKQRIEEELEACIDPAWASPDSDDQEHWDQTALEEKIEHDKIERSKSTHHQGLERQKRNHEFLHALLDGLPARYDAHRHQPGGEDEEWQRDAVDPQVIRDGSPEPRLALDELKFRRAWIKPIEHNERDGEVDERRPERYPARIAPLRR